MSELNKIQNNGVDYSLSDDKVRDLIFFKPGETVTLKNMLCTGYLSGSQKNLHINIILPKRIDLTSSANILSLKMNIRKPDGGYLEYEAYVNGGNEYVGVEGFTVSHYSWQSNQFNIKVLKDTAYLYSTNNVPLSIELCQVTFKFN